MVSKTFAQGWESSMGLWENQCSSEKQLEIRLDTTGELQMASDIDRGTTETSSENHGITELFELEKPSETKSKHSPSTAKPTTKPCP